MSRLIFVYFIILTFYSCQYSEKKDNLISLIYENLDSIFSNFEEIAYDNPSVYLNNPDSFLNDINLLPRTQLQQEIYCSGLIAVGYNLLEFGKIFESIKAYEKAYELVQKYKISIDENQTPLIKPLANLYIRINDSQKAIHLLENYLQNDTIPVNKSSVLNNLANAYLYEGNKKEALVQAKNALNFSTNNLQTALIQNTLSTIYLQSSDSIQSKEYNELAISNFQKSDLLEEEKIWYISALGLNGELNSNSKQIQFAIKLLEKTFPTTQFRNKAKLQLKLGQIFEKYNQLDSAQYVYNNVINSYKKNKNRYNLDYTFTQALINKANLQASKNQVDSAIINYEWAIENDFKTQQLIVNEESQFSGNVWNRNHLNDLAKLISNKIAKNDVQNIKTLLWCIELSKARQLINEINRNDNWNNLSDDKKQAIQKIRLLYQQYDIAVEKNEKSTIDREIQLLIKNLQLSEKHFEAIRFEPNKQNFIDNIENSKNDFYSYLVLNPNYIIVAGYVNKNWLVKKVEQTSIIDSIKIFKETYFKETPNQYNNSPATYKQKAEYLTNVLLPNIDQAAKQIYISPDNELYGFPLDALYANNSFLIQNHDFAYINSFLLFDIIKSQNARKSTSISLLYRSDYEKPLSNLPYVTSEIDNLSSTYDVNKLSPPLQNDSSINKEFSKSNIIHIAAHTILDSIHSPIIYLHNKISTDQLRYFDINTPLVFLSACNTALGKSLPAEGTESIQRVFLSKNVPSVISTYWFANDEAMLTLTNDFYDELSKSKNPIHALASSKRKFLHNANTIQKNPWYWANINYTGIGNELDINTVSNLAHYIRIIGCLALISFIVYIISRFDVTLIYKHKEAQNKRP